MTTVAELLADLRAHDDLLPATERPVLAPGERADHPVVVGSTPLYGPPTQDQAERIRASWSGTPWQAQALISVKLGVPFRPSALYRWRREGTGPPSTQPPTELAFQLDKLDAWIDSLT